MLNFELFQIFLWEENRNQDFHLPTSDLPLSAAQARLPTQNSKLNTQNFDKVSGFQGGTTD